MGEVQAIILAAGLGRRMKPISNLHHKALLEINGKSLISNIIEQLLHFKVSRITIVTGYQELALKNHLKNKFHDENDICFVHNEHFVTTNNLVSLKLGLDSLPRDKDVLIIESDLIFEPKVLNQALKAIGKNIALVSKYKIGMDGTVVSLDGKTITGIIPPHRQGNNFNFDDKYKTLNIYRFSKEFCFGKFLNLLSFYKQSISDRYYELILGIVIYLKTASIDAVIIDNKHWAEIDDPNDLKIAQYKFGERKREILDSQYGGYWNQDIIDFCYLRNMYFPTHAMIAELRYNLEKVIFSYSSAQTVLNQKLSYFLECNSDNIICLNGLSQVYPFLKSYLIDKTLSIPSPTFGEYSKTFPNSNVYPDSPASIELIDALTSEVVIIVNPNNPTGTTLSTDSIYNIASKKRNQLYVIDESFIDFSDQKSMITLLEMKPLENVIVLKSMSKCFGIPGLRIGACYSQSTEFLDALNDYIPIWNANSLAEHFLEISLKYKIEYQESLKKSKEDRQRFISSLIQLDSIQKVIEGQGNFVLCQLNYTEREEKILCDILLDKYNIYVKSVTQKINDGRSWLRFAVRQKHENEMLCNALQNINL